MKKLVTVIIIALFIYGAYHTYLFFSEMNNLLSENPLLSSAISKAVDMEISPSWFGYEGRISSIEVSELKLPKFKIPDKDSEWIPTKVNVKGSYIAESGELSGKTVTFLIVISIMVRRLANGDYQVEIPNANAVPLPKW